MMPLKVKELVEIIGGKLVKGSMAQNISGISIDSRHVKAGELFIPLVGENHDGHRFLKQALENKAEGFLFSKALFSQKNLLTEDKISIEVADTLRALQDIARYHRRRMPVKVVAVTGSTGKTTTKDLIYAVIQQKFTSLKTEGNLNNHIGLPLTLLNLSQKHKAAVLEMGMRAPGEISFLAFLARPDIGVITNVGESHMEILESRERIALAKGELLYWLDHQGIALVNGDDPLCRQLCKYTRAKVFFFGFSPDCQFRAEEKIIMDSQKTQFTVNMPGGKQAVFSVSLPGKHQVYNSLAAIAAGNLLGLSTQEIKEGLENAVVTGMRTEIISSKYGLEIISDVYNSSPGSVKAALDVLAGLGGSNKIVVLGDMLELGCESGRLHREIGGECADIKPQFLVFTGIYRDELKKGALQKGMPGERIYCCQQMEDVTGTLEKIAAFGSVILVKGSRALKMEHVVEFLLQHHA